MRAALHTMSFAGAMAERGFWLYVWKVVTPKGELLYVGRTGDNSSPFASAPYTRMGQHLGSVKSQNALRQHLRKRGLEPSQCARFDLISYGPLFPEVCEPALDRSGLMAKHTPLRNIVGALEKSLAEALAEAKYDVLNTVKWRHVVDPQLWETVRAAFALHFPALQNSKAKVSS